MKKIVTVLIFLMLVGLSGAQNKGETSLEVLNYKDKDGFIVIELMVNGVPGDFLLDLAGVSATILAEYAEKFNITELTSLADHAGNKRLLNKNIEVGKKGVVESITFGNNVFTGKSEFLFVSDPTGKLKSLGVAGTIGGSFFRNSVLTIDVRNKKITTSTPYRPSYMGLSNRDDMKILPGGTATFTISVDGKPANFVFDTWERGLMVFPEKSDGAGNCKFVNVSIPNPEVTIDANVLTPSLGLGLLRYGIISIDYLHAKVYFQSHESTEIVEEKRELLPMISGKVNAITKNEFAEYIFDYKSGDDFVSKSDKPVVVDFWATWCGPCMRLMPEMEKMAGKYKDKVIFYKVNADKEKELCARFNIVALPTLFFIPAGGSPIVEAGATPEKYVEIIETKLLGNE